MTKAIVSLSGGMDSATILAEAIADGRQVQCVGFNYGSRHNPWENRAARQLAEFYKVSFILLDLGTAMSGLRSNLLCGQGDVPEGHYEEETMRQTVVPGRNIVFCAVLAGIAMSEGASEIWMGVHAGDHFIYPDCRPEFIHPMSEAIVAGTGMPIRLVTPFLHGNKTSILQRGLVLGVPYHLTRTCYTTHEIACGKCGSCQERLEAFRNNDVEDPISYVTREALPKVNP